MSVPNVIVVVRGGIVQGAYADGAVAIDVLDFDNWEQAPEDSEEYQSYVEMQKLTKAESFEPVY